jgi:hypothetical protein
MEEFDLSSEIVKEFKRIGYNVRISDVVKLVDALEAQGADYAGNEIAIMAACVAYAAAKGATF